jgi:biotin carboxylase
MGLKDAAKALMEKAGVPVVPGYHGAEQDPDFLLGEAELAARAADPDGDLAAIGYEDFAHRRVRRPR